MSEKYLKVFLLHVKKILTKKYLRIKSLIYCKNVKVCMQKM